MSSPNELHKLMPGDVEVESRTGLELGLRSGSWSAIALVTSLIASLCCVGPLVLLATGLSGAWMSRAMAIEPYQPILIAISLFCVGISGIQLFRKQTCADEVCANGVAQSNVRSALSYGIVFTVVMILLSSEFWLSLFLT